jgi:tetratricopeptide (TPR) repeat protein/cold shock CspA family protein
MTASIMQSQETESEEQILCQAKILEDHKRWKEAASLLKDYQQTHALSIIGLGMLAFYTSRAGDYDNAIVYYKGLCRQEPSVARWCYALGFQYQQKKQWQDAIRSYEKSLSISPGWLLPALRLGESYQSAGQSEKALEAFRKGIQNYQMLSVSRRGNLSSVYAKLCVKTAQIILATPNLGGRRQEEAINLLRESVAAEPNSAINWYYLGSALLKIERLEEALECLKKAEVLDPKKEYIRHKIAQVHLNKGDPDQALKTYERIHQHRRAPYILHGMAQCYMAKGEAMEAARKLHQAIQKEPGKFYHHWEFAMALITLGAKDQAIEALERTIQLFRKEYGKDYHKALGKLEEVRSTLQPGKRVSFDISPSAVTAIGSGTIVKYNPDKGFGFIKDNADGTNVFFHVTRVKGGVPRVGSRIRFVREADEKGFHATKAWF